MKYNNLSRRMFLQGSASAFVTIPFLTSLLPRELWAQTSPATIKRFITISKGYEIGHNSFWIPNNGTSEQINNLPQPNRITPGTNGHHDTRWQPLREFAPTNTSVLAPLYGSSLSPYLESMNILRSLDLPSRYGHGFTQILGGLPPGEADNGLLKTVPTIDYFLNSSAKFNPAALPLISTHNGSSFSQSLAGSSVVNTSNIGTYFSNLYNGLFANGSYPESGQAVAVNPKANILNRVLEDYNRVRNSRNISKEDKLALDNVFDKFSDIQRGFNLTSTAQCKYKDFFTTHVDVKSTDDSRGFSYIQAKGKAVADLMSAAIMCDSVRVMNLSAQMQDILGIVDGETFDHQLTSHQPLTIANGKYQWQRLGSRQATIYKNFIAPLVQNLSSAIDPSNGKSFLYNSLIYCTNESAQVHGWGSHPVILFGNAGGTMTTGNYIDYADRSKGAFKGADSGVERFNEIPGNLNFSNNWRGVSYNRLLVSIAQAMGFTPAEYEQNALNAQLYNRIDIGDLNKSLTSIGGFGYAYRIDITQTNYRNTTFKPTLAFYDLKQFKYKLPIL